MPPVQQVSDIAQLVNSFVYATKLAHDRFAGVCSGGKLIGKDLDLF
jgi:hypothetical protein